MRTDDRDLPTIAATPHTVIGIDPGVTTGLCALHVCHGAVTRHQTVQCDQSSVTMVLDGLLARSCSHRRVAIEAFVVRARASSTGEHGRITRDLIAACRSVALIDHVPVSERPAGTVKPWATDKRLTIAGLHTGRGMGHARDAARHALYDAVQAGLLADPLVETP